MASLSTHILDTSIGLPAPNVRVACDHQIDGPWVRIGEGVTDEDGRIKGLHGEAPMTPGDVYRLTFFTAPYFDAQDTTVFYPQVEVQFLVGTDKDHYHVPLLLNPFGYSTYRGS